MSLSWQFYQQQATDSIRNPIAGEFFSTEAVGNIAEALVREGVQNTLDARIKASDQTRSPAHVRIFISEADGALRPSRASYWFKTLWPHVLAKGNGLRDQPTLETPCPFIVFEDFGTTGLDGDPDTHLAVDNVANHFLNFFRAEGHSDKGAQDRGSWGVGKTVFPRSSRIGSFIGLTFRSSDKKQLLLGRSILKYHQIGTQHFKSDGYLGVLGADGLILPTNDAKTIDEFKQDFKLQRNGENGLSIVIPWYEIEGDETLSRKSIITAVLRGFFYPILMGHLAITIATTNSELKLAEDTIFKEAKAIEKELGLNIFPIIDLAFWAQTRRPDEFMHLLPSDSKRAQSWTSELVPSEVVSRIRSAFASRQRIALKVPMAVQAKIGEPKETYFNVFLEHCDEDGERPVFIRDELIITDVKSSRLSQVRALVIIEHSYLANLLRDAETPAHTQWNSDTSNFKNKYKFGPAVIKFVRQSVSEILRIINQSEEKPDPSITIDYFSIPSEPEDPDAIPGRHRKPKQANGAGPTVPPLPLPSTPRRFKIVTMDGGFAVRPGGDGVQPPNFLDVRMAYDIRHGNPLKKYVEADFDLGKHPIKVHPIAGAEVVQCAGNRLRIAIAQPEFNVEVRGFDQDRDLYIRAEASEAENDN